MAAATPKSSPWNSKTLPRLVLIIGAESALREEALAAVRAAAFGKDEPGMNIVTLHGPAANSENSGPNPADVLDEVCTASMFGGDDELKLVVVRQADVFLTDKDSREIFERALERIPDSSTLVLEAATYGQLKNTRFYKGLAEKKAVIECEALTGKFGDTRELEAEVEKRARAKGLNLSHGALLSLVGRSARNLGVLQEELDKLALCLEANPQKPVNVSEEHVEDLCASSATFGAFNFVDAVVDRNAGKALEVLGGIFDRGIADSAKPGKVITNESSITMLLLGALTWRLSQLQDVQSGIEQGKREFDVFSEFKIFGFRQEEMRRVMRKHSSTSLRRSMDALFRANLDLRMGGANAQEVMEQLVWRIIKS